MKTSPFVIQITALEGDPDGIRQIELLNWSGKAIVFPRMLVQKVRQRQEYMKPGVYILCNAFYEGEPPKIYIGEGDEVGKRIDEHFANKDFWTWCVYFTSSDDSLDKVHVQYLESELVRLAKEAKQAKLDNGNTPRKPNLSVANETMAVGFLDHLLVLLPLIGIRAFEQVQGKASADSVMVLSGKGVSGKGYDTPAGFVVCAGSTASIKSAVSLALASVERRKSLVESGVLLKDGESFKFTQDHTFGSPSAAAEAILATPTNGRDAWKDKDGKSMNQLAKSATQQP